MRSRDQRYRHRFSCFHFLTKLFFFQKVLKRNFNDDKKKENQNIFRLFVELFTSILVERMEVLELCQKFEVELDTFLTLVTLKRQEN